MHNLKVKLIARECYKDQNVTKFKKYLEKIMREDIVQDC